MKVTFWHVLDICHVSGLSFMAVKV